MSTSVTWPPIGGSSYLVPNEAGEVNWTDLTDFLVALAAAQGTGNQKVGTRVATVSPVTVSSTTDYMLVTDLTAPGAVAVNLPAAVLGQAFIIKDGKGDAATNNITVNRNGSDTIDGATSVVLSGAYASVMLICTAAGKWNTYKTFVTKSDIGLGNVDNTSDATKNAAVATLTNKTLTTPVIGDASSIVAASASVPGVVTTGTQTFAGAKTFSSAVTLPAITLTATSPDIVINTSDGSDTKYFGFSGGGASGNGRGGYGQIFGNEAATFGGQWYQSAGNAATSAGTNKAFRWFGAASAGAGETEIMYLTGAGALISGPSSGLTASHIFNSGKDQTTVSTASGHLWVQNTRTFAVGERSVISLGTGGGVSAQLVGVGTTDSSGNYGGFELYTRNAGMTLAVSVSAAGALTAGPTSGSTLEHFFQSGANTYIAAKSVSNGLAGLELYNASTAAWNIVNVGTAAANGLEIRNASNAAVASSSQVGGWIFGIAANNVVHTIQNTSTDTGTCLIRNNSTSTSSDSIPSLLVQKGSTTNTSGTNRFVLFRINAGATDSGYIGSNGSNAANFYSTSDRRLKTDISDLSGGLSTVMAMRPVNFKWKQDGSAATGFIAQELAEAAPQFVCKTDDGQGEELPEGQQPWNMTEGGMSAFLVKAIQEQQALIENLKARIESLEAA